MMRAVGATSVAAVHISVWMEARHWSEFVQMLNFATTSVKLSVGEPGCQFDRTWPMSTTEVESSFAVSAPIQG